MAANLPKELLQKFHAEEDLVMASEGTDIDEGEVGIGEEEADQEEDNGTCISCVKSKNQCSLCAQKSSINVQRTGAQIQQQEQAKKMKEQSNNLNQLKWDRL